MFSRLSFEVVAWEVGNMPFILTLRSIGSGSDLSTTGEVSLFSFSILSLDTLLDFGGFGLDLVVVVSGVQLIILLLLPVGIPMVADSLLGFLLSLKMSILQFLKVFQLGSRCLFGSLIRFINKTGSSLSTFLLVSGDLGSGLLIVLGRQLSHRNHFLNIVL